MPLSKAMLVTLLALIAGFAGIVVGIFAGSVGHLTLFAATAVAVAAAVGTFGLGLAVLAYLRP
ncbi:hypothetical protein [Streptomyces sp. IBSBF 3136]|uniref:hypothetical protein n=1 Tax=Streptomyces sp. IBSBF 3136 TaxID=2903524 RepID=UPI002FDC0EAF